MVASKPMRLSLLILSFCLSASAALQVRYSFEGILGTSITDQTGNGHDGVQMNPTNRISATNGVGGSQGAFFSTNGYSSDGVSQYILGCYLAITNLTGITTLTQCTVSVWAQFYNKNYSSNAPQQTVALLLDNRWNTSVAPLASNSWTMGRYFSDNVTVVVSDGSSNARKILDFPSDAANPQGNDYSTSTFHMYCWTANCSANTIIAYYDGSPYQTNTIGLPYLHVYGSATVPWIAIGCDDHGAVPQWCSSVSSPTHCFPNDGYFHGLMDEVRIYDNVLTPSEVTFLYQNPTLPGPPSLSVSGQLRVGTIQNSQ